MRTVARSVAVALLAAGCQPIGIHSPDGGVAGASARPIDVTQPAPRGVDACAVGTWPACDPFGFRAPLAWNVRPIGGTLHATAGDLDGDGRAEVVYVADDARLHVARWRGDGTFDDRATLAVDSHSTPQLVDLDGDGHLDVLLAGPHPAAALSRAGALGPLIPVDERGVGGAITTADLDGDGHLDLVTAKGIARGRGDGTFHTLVAWAPPSFGNGAAAAGDLDGDGVVDAVVWRYGVRQTYNPYSSYETPVAMTIRFGDRVHPFECQIDVPTPADYFADGDLRAADLDGDGRVELYVSDGINAVWRYELTIARRVIGPQRVVDGSIWRGFTFIDVDGDGRRDIVSPRGIASGGEALDRFDWRPFPYWWDGVNDTAVGDLDGDGHLDLVFSRTMLTVLFGDGIRAFPRPIPVEAPGWFSIAGDTFGEGPFVDGAVFGDLDGDGRTDLVVASGPGVDVYLGSEQGPRLRSQIAVLPKSDPGPILGIADFDGDGRADIAVGTFTDSQPAPVLRLLFGDGSGAFPREIDLDGPGIACGHVADLDGDGRPDLVTTTFPDASASTSPGDDTPRTGSVVTWLNRGAGNLVASVAPGLTVPWSTADTLFPVDMDADGRSDLVLLDGGHLATARGHGDGTFTVVDDTGRNVADTIYQWETPVLLARGSITVGDVTSDGIPDVLLRADRFDMPGDYRLFAGAHDLSLTDRGSVTPTFLGGPPPALVDLDGDGDLDMVQQLSRGDSGDPATLLLRNDGGRFTLVRAYAGEFDFAGDFDGDGRPDLFGPSGALLH